MTEPTNPSKLVTDLLENLPVAIHSDTRKAIENVLRQVEGQAEIMVLKLIQQLLESLAQGEGLASELADLPPEQMDELEASLMELLSKLAQSEGMEKEEDALRYLLHVISQKIRKRKKEQDPNFEFDFMSRYQKGIYKQHLLEMMQYEVYKFINPRQVAGETLVENFINNVLHKGMGFAMEYATGTELEKITKDYGKSFVQQLEDQQLDRGKLRELGHLTPDSLPLDAEMPKRGRSL